MGDRVVPGTCHFVTQPTYRAADLFQQPVHWYPKARGGAHFTGHVFDQRDHRYDHLVIHTAGHIAQRAAGHVGGQSIAKHGHCGTDLIHQSARGAGDFTHHAAYQRDLVYRRFVQQSADPRTE